MYLYFLYQEENSGYDTFDSAVVCAASEEEARNTPVGNEYTWAQPSNVEVRLLGIAKEDCPIGVICASFNAG